MRGIARGWLPDTPELSGAGPGSPSNNPPGAPSPRAAAAAISGRDGPSPGRTSRRGTRMSRHNLADLMVETLAAAGVSRIYGVVGDSLNGLTEALRRRETIEWVHVRHEEV